MTIQQYDTIGDAYVEFPQLPTGRLQLAALESIIGALKGETVLDLACGTGFYCRKALEWGASKAVGVDISAAMVDAARVCANGNPNLEFHVADCGKPIDVGQFDIVLAPWLLNYSRTESELRDMWENIHRSLKPGGRIVGISPNVHILEDLAAFPRGVQFGQGLEVVGGIGDGGLEVRVTLCTSTPFSFNNYYLPRVLYARSCREVQLCDFRWESFAKPLLQDVDWVALLRCPPFRIFTASRPL
ncbi:S-adenosyl-L-methionine-dependent methyltransferase [Aspergillus carlsbadensis]|nr:S-adenosyl-L-methionine-dependent methyltransferase [Aspergillus carlsbadensis]